ncbi:cytochrome c-type biogenesis protein DsbD [alpha proteobacterium U9-1i]|nr:cytochrome c-type biogenesis protein DsbD [alpha proteobacterium U9-1i]
MGFRSFFAALTVVFALSVPAIAQPVRTDNVEVEFHSARAAIAPGETFTIVLRQNIREHWHTYWRNPGDSGEPTEITWSLPPGWSAGDIQWPAPEAIPFDVLVNYGYSGEVLFPVTLTAPANLRPGENVTLSANVYMLVCSDICIPEEADLTLTLSVDAQGRDDTIWAPRIAEAIAALPRRDDNIAARVTPGTPPRLSVAIANLTDVGDAHFFPFSRDALDHAAPQLPSAGESGVSFTLKAGVAENLGAAPLEGVVVVQTANGRRAYEINAEPGEPLPGTSGGAVGVAPVEPLALPALLAALGFAFLGGLILNIMPCVLPVLSIKALSLAGGAHSGEAKRHGLIYLAGVLATFLALAGGLIALRGAGEAVGWGFQLQAPWVTAGLALLFFVIGLNLVGLFEVGGSLQNVGGGFAQRGGDAGAFFTGALAVIAATPCTAPFMAGAIGAVLTQSAGVTLLVFAMLALGFALPLVALSFAPGLQRLMPKPGAWMERAKHVLAFPMFAAAVWMAWVLTEQAGASGALALLSLTLALTFAIYVARWGRVWLAVGAIVLVATGAMFWRPLLGQEQVAIIPKEEWSPARVTELRGEGRAVFVNFTAAWCVTCKVNEVTVFSDPDVARAFEEENVTYLEADWTNRDETIAAALAEHGRAGVPLYLFYPADGGAPTVLPQLLTEALITQTIVGDTP